MSDQSNENLVKLGQAITGRLVAADPEDLAGLSTAHEALGTLSDELEQFFVNVDTTEVCSKAEHARVLIEQIVLREADDAQAVLQNVRQLADELRQWIERGGVEQVGAGCSAAEQTSVADEPAVSDTAFDRQTASDEGAQRDQAALLQQEPPLRQEDLPLITEFIAEARGHLESAEAQLLKLEETPDDAEAIAAIFRSFHTIKGVAGFLGLKQIGALAHASESLLVLVREGQFRFEEPLADAVLQASDLMKRLLSGIEQAAATGEAVAMEPSLPQVVRLLERCARGEGARAHPDVVHAPEQEAKSSQPSASHAAVHGDATIKVATSRLDALINMVGELVIAQAMVAQDMATQETEASRLNRDISHVGKIVRELQDLSMAMRMVPIQGLFQKMGRLVRDLCKKLDKQIELVISGGETELDRNVVEVLGDPLMHMVRNAGDHGIECPADREKAGKPRKGRLELRARHEAGNIVIEIVDDGKGLDRQRILRKAIAAGIIAEGQELNDQDILRLIFHPGLSTAEKVTDVSGRGVGMDVVKKNIEDLRGRIDIESTPGKGSVFTIRLPLTLAVIDGLVARVGHQRYIIPTKSIEQSLRPGEKQLSTVQGRGEACLVRGELLVVHRLHRIFDVEGAVEDVHRALLVIVRDNNRRCCLMVDELLGQQQVVIKSLGDGIGAVPGVSGGAILGDGAVSLILDVHGLVGSSPITGASN